MKHVGGLIASLKVAPTSPAALVPAADREASQRRQRAAFEDLKPWYNDWAGTLRDELPYHDAVRLGIRENKGGRRKVAKEDGE